MRLASRRAAAIAILLTVAGIYSRLEAQIPPRSQTPKPGKLLALVGGRLIDGYGGPPIENSVIVVEGERIKAIGQVGTLAVPAGAQVISTEGMSVLPGLWDMHVHLMINGHADYDHWDKTYPAQFEKVIMPASAKQLLLAGVTSARDLCAARGLHQRAQCY
ncbi:MAG: amidohydrolase family protein [Acidobacteriales bacterium]|nr:amidohydrolase family protein [Terriglobales bacterium]